MKKTLSLLTACLLLAGVSLSLFSCKKNSAKDLAYQGISKNKYIEAYVNKKGGVMVLWLQVLDRIDDKANVDSYKKSAVKFEKYPAKIYDDKSVWILVNNRIEIRVTADDTAKDFQDTGELKQFIKLFDLAGMEKVTGPKLKAEDLEKFIPVLGGK